MVVATSVLQVLESSTSTGAKDKASPSPAAECPSMSDVVKAHLEAHDWKYKEKEYPDPNRRLFLSGFQGEGGSFQVVFDMNEGSQTLSISVRSQFNFPRAHRLPLCEYIARANYSLILGSFEIDMSDGEVSFKVASFAENFTDAMVLRNFHVGLSAMNEHFPKMMKVAYGVLTTEQAFAKEEEQKGQ